MSAIIAVLVPRCSSCASLPSSPPPMDPISLELGRQVLLRAFRLPWPHRN